jgi:hypothetical protein
LLDQDDAGEQAADDAAERVPAVEPTDQRAGAVARGREGGAEDRQRRPHAGGRRQHHDEGDREAAERLGVRRLERRPERVEQEAVEPADEPRDERRRDGDGGLEERVDAQEFRPRDDAPAGEPRAEREPGQEGGDDRRDRRRRTAEDVGEVPRPEHLVDEGGAPRDEHVDRGDRARH